MPISTFPSSLLQVIRAHLTVPVEFAAGEVIVRDVSTVFGGFMERNDDEVVISATWVRSVRGTTHPATGEPITIPLHNLQSLEVKRLAPLPTAALAGLIALTVVMVPVVLSGSGSEGNGGGDTDPGPTFPVIRSR